MICENCRNKFESDEGIIYDCDTFVCFECKDELETENIILMEKIRLKNVEIEWLSDILMIYLSEISKNIDDEMMCVKILEKMRNKRYGKRKD